MGRSAAELPKGTDDPKALRWGRCSSRQCEKESEKELCAFRVWELEGWTFALIIVAVVHPRELRVYANSHPLMSMHVLPVYTYTVYAQVASYRVLPFLYQLKISKVRVGTH